MLPEVEVEPPRAAKILVVEDEGVIASHIQSRLTNGGYEVTAIAQSSEEALTQIATTVPDLILMDIHIKGDRDGIQTAADVRARYDIPIIYLTAHTDRETIDRAKLSGASNFLSKPIHATTLSTSIEMTLHKHRADSDVRRQRAWMATVLNGMGDAVIVVDSDQKVQFLNAQAETLTGWSAREAQLRDLAAVLPLADAVSGLPANEHFRPGPSVFQTPHTLTARKRNGKRFPIEAEVSPSFDGERIAGAIITFRDATSRQSREYDLRQQDKMQAIGRLAAGIAHDFNNLIFVIVGYTDELIRAPHLGEAELGALNEILKAAGTAARITRQLLKFSHKESVEKQLLDLNEVVRDSKDFLCRVAGPSVELEIELASDLGAIRADQGQLKQVLMNLVANAHDAMPNGGRIRIETANISLPRGGVPGNPVEPFISLTVSDTGCGISAETASKLFEPFFTTKSIGKGTGLGLSIVHSIVTDLGGLVHVESEPGEGAVFTLYFPCSGGSVAAPLPAAATPAPGAEPDPLTVLLVAEDDEVRRLVRQNLAEAGSRVLEAGNGDEAIRLAADFPGRIDLMIAEAVMPKASGFEAARTVARQRSGLKVIFISGYSQERLDVAEDIPPGSQFLPKPFSKADLERQMGDLLRRGKALSGRPAA